MISLEEYAEQFKDWPEEISPEEMLFMYEFTKTLAAFTYKSWIAQRIRDAESRDTIEESCQQNPSTPLPTPE